MECKNHESDENIVSGSESDDDWLFIAGVFHDLKRWIMQWTCILYVP